MNLVIVESPNKARKIKEILSKIKPNEHWEVMPTGGHIKDLPKNKLGIAIDQDFALTWVNTNYKNVAIIRSQAKNADDIYIAADGDMEGEAIAQHVSEALHLHNPKRLLIYEITEHGVKKALESVTKINQDLVAAQSARRALDRLIGYKLSPLAWRGLGAGTSAGRVQSCVLARILARDLARRAHEPKSYFQVSVPIKNTRICALSGKLSDKDAAERLIKLLPNATPNFRTVIKTLQPFPPFNTASALRHFSIRFGMSTSDTMGELQRLYERGLITYLRTDSSRLSGRAIGMARDYLTKNHSKYLNPQARNYSSGKHAQGAHEAIRPTNIHLLPSQLRLVSNRSIQIYAHIWARCIATQATPAILEEQTCTWEYKGETLLTAHGGKFKDLGWHVPSLRFFLQEPTDITSPKLVLVQAKVNKEKTQPQSRLTIAQIIKWMQDHGVGRPSTYSSTINKLQYAHSVNGTGSLHTTLKGEALTYFIKKVVPELLNAKFTAEMETRLDKIANGKSTYLKLMQRYWSWLGPKLETKHLKAKSKCTCGNRYFVRMNKKRPPFLLCKQCKIEQPALGGDKCIIMWESHIEKRFCPSCRIMQKFATTATPKTGVKAKCNTCSTQYKLEDL